MKITAVETCVVSLPFDMGGPKPAFAGKPWTTLDVLVVKVETEDGLTGWGEDFGHSASPATQAASDNIGAPPVLGRVAGALNGLSRQIPHSLHLLGRNGSFLYGWSGIEIALWDLAGKRAGQPLYRLLGGCDPGPMGSYARLVHYGDDALVAKNTADACAAGYRFIKLHEVTRPAVLAARRVASDAAIMLDVNCAWSPQVARDMAASLAGDGLYWLGEPVWPPEDVHGLARLRGYCMPISAG